LIDYASSHPGWEIGFLDEVWWSRFALPQLHCWQDQDDPVRLLPTKSPWLNPIESKWVHGKRNVVEADRLLSARQFAERVCAYFGCRYEDHLSFSEKVS
jgi:hypothetical protein